MKQRLWVLWFRIRDIPWSRIAAGAGLALVIVVLVPPLRRAAALAASRTILVVTSPFAPSIKGFDDLPQASKVLAADGSVVGQLGREERHPVKLAGLPPHIPEAVLAAEDANFEQHAGVDMSAITRAVLNDVRGRSVQGGSTITQQLAKLNYTGSQRTFFRKFREVLYASRLEQKYSKRQLLERYLNQVYFGDGCYGIAAAADHYFGVTPDKLDVTQAATLAGMIHAPGTLNPYRRADAVVARRNQVLTAMARHHWLAADAKTPATAAPLAVVPERPAPTAPGRAPHFTQFVAREAASLDALGGTGASRAKQVFTGGYTFETTLDVPALDAATEAVQQNLGGPGDPTTAVASVQPGDGAIRLLFGGLDVNRNFDVASQGRRQPGSSFKPFVYVAALEAGIDPRSVLDSASPKTVSCAGAPWTVKNYEGEGHGQMSVDQAMAHSVNTVFQQLMADVGPATVQRTAMRFGIPKDALSPARCAMALGGLPQGVSPLEQAAAYATFAAKGIYASPYSIVRIKNRAGELIYDRQQKTGRVMPEKEAGVVNNVLQTVIGDGTGGAAGIGRPVAGKTGTTENYADAWFIGYVPQLATAVWVGYPDALVPMTDVHGGAVAGGGFPARIFGRYMRAALTNVPEEPLFTASPDELALGNLNGPPPPPPTTLPPDTTTTPPAPAPLDQPAPPPADQTPAPGNSSGGSNETVPSPQPAPRPTTTTTRPPAPTTTLKQKATSQTTLTP